MLIRMQASVAEMVQSDTNIYIISISVRYMPTRLI